MIEGRPLWQRIVPCRFCPTQRRHSVENSASDTMRHGWHRPACHAELQSNISGANSFLVFAIDMPDFAIQARQHVNQLIWFFCGGHDGVMGGD